MKLPFKIRKTYLVIVLLVAGVYAYFWCNSLLIRHGYRNHGVRNTITYVLGIPFANEERNLEPILSKDLSPYLEQLKLSSEEWNKTSCQLAIKQVCKDTSRGEIRGQSCWNETTLPYDSPLYDCIFGPVYEKNFYSAEEKYCSFFHPEKCESLILNEYVLNRPDILKIILEVSKSPCKYLPTKEKFEALKKLDEYHARLVKQTINDLGCWNDKVKKYRNIILNINDLYGNHLYHIFVKRED